MTGGRTPCARFHRDSALATAAMVAMGVTRLASDHAFSRQAALHQAALRSCHALTSRAPSQPSAAAASGTASSSHSGSPPTCSLPS